MLIEGNLGVLNTMTKTLLKQLDSNLKVFRVFYKPFDFEYDVDISETEVIFKWNDVIPKQHILTLTEL